MTENNTTMNNQAVTFMNYTLNDVVEYLEKRKPDEQMEYALTFSPLSKIHETTFIASKEKTTVSKNLSTLKLMVSGFAITFLFRTLYIFSFSKNNSHGHFASWV